MRYRHIVSFLALLSPALAELYSLPLVDQAGKVLGGYERDQVWRLNWSALDKAVKDEIMHAVDVSSLILHRSYALTADPRPGHMAIHASSPRHPPQPFLTAALVALHPRPYPLRAHHRRPISSDEHQGRPSTRRRELGSRYHRVKVPRRVP